MSVAISRNSSKTLVRDVPLNIVIPMGGVGSRFKRDGYKMPKPLVNIFARPIIFWLIENLRIRNGDILFLAVQIGVEEEYGVVQRIRDEFPEITTKVTLLDGLTRGCAETLYLILNDMTGDEIKRKTISLDCDTIYFSDVLSRFRQLSCDEGCCFNFIDEGNVPMYSYIKFDGGTRRITNIAEKERISSYANTGAYGFANTKALRLYLEKLLVKPLPASGEFYVSDVIRNMLRSGYKFIGLPAPDFHCVGTPTQLRSFIKYLWYNPDMVKKGVIGLDFTRRDESSEGSIDSVPSTLDEVLSPKCLPKVIMLRLMGFEIKLFGCIEEEDDIRDWGFRIEESEEKRLLVIYMHRLFCARDDLSKEIGF